MQLYRNRRKDIKHTMEGQNKSLFQLFVPLCLETIFYMLSGMVDTLMLSSVGDQAVGAVGTANTLSGHFRLRILLLSLIQKIASCGTINPMGSKRNDPMQREILTYLQYNYTEPLRLETLAEQFHLSEKYLSRYFKQHFHLTLTQYLMHLRLTHACHLLESTSLPVTEVALQSGFPNVSHFIRCFHRTYQMSPLQYRKQLPYQ